MQSRWRRFSTQTATTAWSCEQHQQQEIDDPEAARDQR